MQARARQPAGLRHLAPARDEHLVQHVPLVDALAEDVARPVPLHRGGLEQPGRRVGVVLEQLGHAVVAVGEVEAPVEHRRLGLPRLPDARDRPARDPHLGEEVLRDDVVAGLDEHLEHEPRGRLDVVDLVARQGVVGALVPVGDLLAVGQRRLPVDEALLLDRRGPALARLDVVAIHLTSPAGQRNRPEPTGVSRVERVAMTVRRKPSTPPGEAAADGLARGAPDAAALRARPEAAAPRQGGLVGRVDPLAGARDRPAPQPGAAEEPEEAGVVAAVAVLVVGDLVLWSTQYAVSFSPPQPDRNAAASSGTTTRFTLLLRFMFAPPRGGWRPAAPPRRADRS